MSVRTAVAFVLVAACGGAATAAGRSRPVAKPPAHVVAVRAEIVAGTPQTVHAYVATDGTKYVADYPVQLAVRIAGGVSGVSKRRVKFRCANPHCALFAPDQPEGGDRQGPSDYEIDAKNGKASLHVSIESARPAGAYVVYVEPIAKPGERSVRSGPFNLTSQ